VCDNRCHKNHRAAKRQCSIWRKPYLACFDRHHFCHCITVYPAPPPLCLSVSLSVTLVGTPKRLKTEMVCTRTIRYFDVWGFLSPDFIFVFFERELHPKIKHRSTPWFICLTWPFSLYQLSIMSLSQKQWWQETRIVDAKLSSVTQPTLLRDTIQLGHNGWG